MEHRGPSEPFRHSDAVAVEFERILPPMLWRRVVKVRRGRTRTRVKQGSMDGEGQLAQAAKAHQFQ